MDWGFPLGLGWAMGFCWGVGLDWHSVRLCCGWGCGWAAGCDFCFVVEDEGWVKERNFAQCTVLIIQRSLHLLDYIHEP